MTAAVRKQVEEVLPDAQVMDFKEGNPALSQGLDNATSILSLICLGGDGAGRDRRGDGDACAPRTAHGYARHSEGRGRGIVGPAAHLSAADDGSWDSWEC